MQIQAQDLHFLQNSINCSHLGKKAEAPALQVPTVQYNS